MLYLFYNVVLIKEDNAPRINLRVGIIDSFMPSRDGIQRNAIVCYVINGNTSEIRRKINPTPKIIATQKVLKVLK